jgi:hypothetical protein
MDFFLVAHPPHDPGIPYKLVVKIAQQLSKRFSRNLYNG